MEPDRQGQCPKGQNPKGQNPQQASTDGPIHAGQCSAISLHETPLQDLLLSQQTPWASPDSVDKSLRVTP